MLLQLLEIYAITYAVICRALPWEFSYTLG